MEAVAHKRHRIWLAVVRHHVPAGAPADINFSLYYAPPEVVIAFKDCQTQVDVQPSMDVWSLGVSFDSQHLLSAMHAVFHSACMHVIVSVCLPDVLRPGWQCKMQVEHA